MTHRLSDEDREALMLAIGTSREVYPTIEAIVAREVAAGKEERDQAQEHIAYHLRDFRPTADMAATGDLAVDMASYADRMRARAEAAEAKVAAVAELADRIEDEEHVEGCGGQSDCAACIHADLRAALGEA